MVISWSELNPFVSSVNRLVCSPGFTFGSRVIFDHQFILVTSGSGQVQIQDRRYEASSGDLFYYGPDIVHRFTADLETPFTLLGLHFSLRRSFPEDGEFAHLIPADVEEAYSAGTANHCVVGIPDKDSWWVPEHSKPDLAMASHYFGMIADNFMRAETIAHLYNRSLLIQFLIELRDYSIRHLPLPADDQPRMIAAMRRRLKEHAADAYSREWLREWTGYHENYSSRLFREHCGRSPHEYFTEQKIDAAKRLLATTDLTVGEIADRLHIATIHYFSRLFKQHTGQTPKQFRQTRQMIL